jgi:uncharacterized DUF497 family protein
VRFEQAIVAFDDPDGFEIVDTDFDYGEERIILTGLAAPGVVVVVYTELGVRIRIISARRASKYEREFYCRQKAQ